MPASKSNLFPIAATAPEPFTDEEQKALKRRDENLGGAGRAAKGF